MNTENQSNPVITGDVDVPNVLREKRSHWWWFLLLGIALIILGTVAISVPCVVSWVTVELFGVLLLIGGVAQIVSSFWEGEWGGFFIHMLTGILYGVVGGLILGNPLQGLAVLTLLMAAFLIVNGISRILFSVRIQFHQWGWILLSGVVSLLLGIMIWAQWPKISLVVIGLFIGIEMIFNGWSWVMLALSVRAIPADEV